MAKRKNVSGKKSKRNATTRIEKLLRVVAATDARRAQVAPPKRFSVDLPVTFILATGDVNRYGDKLNLDGLDLTVFSTDAAPADPTARSQILTRAKAETVVRDVDSDFRAGGPTTFAETRAWEVVSAKGPVNLPSSQRAVQSSFHLIRPYLTEDERAELSIASDHALQGGEGREEWDAVCKRIEARWAAAP